MFEVQILDTNASIFKKELYSYVEFDELSEQMMELEWVLFLIVKRKKEFYKGKYIRYDQTAHEDIQSKIMNQIETNQMKKKTGLNFLTSLDKEFQHPTYKKKEKQLSKKALFPLSKQIVQIGILTICILLVTIGGFLGFQEYILSKDSQQQIGKTKHLDELLNSANYQKAAELFPDKLIEIEATVLEKKDFNQLATFQENYPTIEGEFDLAYHQEDWQKVVAFDSATLTDQRKSMLAIAYLKLNQMEAAEILNKYLQSEEIAEQIRQMKFLRAITALQSGDIQQAESIQKELQNNQLTELIETAKVCQEMIDFYKKKKEIDNEIIWKNRLKNLGKEWFINEETME